MAVDIVPVLSSHTWLVATRLDTRLRTFLSLHRVWWRMLIHNIGENEDAKRSLGSWINVTDYIQEKHKLACETSHSPGCPTLDMGGWGFPCPSLDRETNLRRKMLKLCYERWDVKDLVSSHKAWTHCCLQNRTWEWLFPGTVFVFVPQG